MIAYLHNNPADDFVDEQLGKDFLINPPSAMASGWPDCDAGITASLGDIVVADPILLLDVLLALKD